MLASPEPSSFATALATTAVDALAAAGWDVTLLDLYRERFDPVLSEADFTERLIADRLQPMDEQAHAAARGSFAPELARHVELFALADLLLLVSPMWWFSVPAMLKGWIDRVFANGVAYRYPEVPAWSGFLSSKRAMLVMTSSYERRSFREDGVGTLEHVLHPILYGTLAYTGMTVLEPFIAYAADSVDDETRAAYLDSLRDRLASLEPGAETREGGSVAWIPSPGLPPVVGSAPSAREKGATVAIMMILELEGVSVEEYERVNELMGIRSDADAPDGLISHVAAVGDEGEVVVVDLWESEQALGGFFENRLGPALAEAGIPPAPPRIHPVHNQMHSAVEGNVLILIEVDDTGTDVYDRMAAEMPEHTGDPANYPWAMHAVASDGTGIVVADLWPSEEAFGQFAQQRIAPTAQKHGMGSMRQRAMKVHDRLRGPSTVGA